MAVLVLSGDGNLHSSLSEALGWGQLLLQLVELEDVIWLQIVTDAFNLSHGKSFLLGYA